MTPARFSGWACVLIVILHLPLPAKAQEFWRIQGSLYTTHFDSDPEHNNHNKLIALEAWRDERWHGGLALFDNSYDQFSQYLYIGYARDFDQAGRYYWRVTGGLVHGYKEPYEDKIPFNNLGIAPAIIPSVGIRVGPVFSEVQVLGTVGVMLTLGYSWGD